jgi:uncharacterized membrane protein (UPF0127 family)
LQGSAPHWRARSYCLHAVLLLVLACASLAGCSRRPEVVIYSATGPVRVPVEVVTTPETRARGLMYRRDLAANAGMLFVFPNETPQQFWMKNTPLPLDMVFIGKGHHVVGIVADTRPFSTTPLGVAAPSQYVLEVHAGFCASRRIAAGARVDFVRVPSADR